MKIFARLSKIFSASRHTQCTETLSFQFSDARSFFPSARAVTEQADAHGSFVRYKKVYWTTDCCDQIKKNCDAARNLALW